MRLIRREVLGKIAQREHSEEGKGDGSERDGRYKFKEGSK
jgi:hypothetical protein